MKIVFLSRLQNKVSRGAENFVLELSKRLSKNYQVDILSGNDADNILKVIKGGYDIAIPINGRLQSLKTSLGRITGKYKLLITGHSGIGRDDIWNIAVARPDVFVALTDFMAKWAKQWAWASRVVKIPNGIDLDKFSPEGEKIKLDLKKPIILSVGALVWYKHHEKVIDAVSRLRKGSVLIVGEGELKEDLKKLGKEKLGDRFMISNFSYEDMPKVYRSSDLFTLPSWDREAFGIVYLEAMASGLGVVAPNDVSRREILGDAGLFAEISNPIDYAETVKKALGIDWVKLARAQAEKFSWEKVAKEYEELMLNMIKQKGCQK
ncbi:MAG: glycosyltransferase [Candidatus Daviesbacteria bacterium]|nr:glycosyltransferase [Candidatus Daviesbacteria bacterium]